MALPFLLSLGLPALGAATGMAASPLLLSGIGAGLGSFLQTGDVGKGIQTGLIAGLGGKLMSSATSALSGAGAQAAGAAAGAAPAAAQTTGNKFLTSLIGEKALAAPIGATTVGGALGAAGSGFNTGLVADAMNVPTVKMPEKKTYDTSPPMPRIISYQPKTDISSTAEEDMIRYYNPVQRKNLGGIMSMSGSHPIFNQFGQQMSGYLGQAQAQANKQKVGPFVQQVEQLAKTTFGDEAFQQNLSDYTQQTESGDRFQPVAFRPGFGMSPNDMVNESRMSPEEQKDMVGILSGKGTSSTGAQRGVNNFAQALGRGTGSMMSMMRRPGAMGFAEGGEVEVPEEMNEKDVIVEAVKAIKGLSDAPEVALGIFLSEYGEEALRDLVDKVQSGALDDTIERFANGDKGMVEGMGDGSGEDDMIPASLDGEQDVLLTEGEFVMRQPTTKAIQDEFGSEFLDIINQSEDKAPEKIREMVGVES